MTADAAPLEVSRIIQITDLHLGPTADFRLAGVCTLDSFREVLAWVKRETFPLHMVMVTGDIAAEGVAQAYQLFTEHMQATTLPYAWLPGNHDDFQVMQESVSSAPYWPLLEVAGWNLISLNSAEVGKVAGRLDREELGFLETVLQRNPDTPTVIFMHHPPWPVEAAWLDRHRVADAGELASILADATNVKAIFTGHVHQDFTGQWAGIPVYCTPSTCFQFARKTENFQLSTEPPAYRWIDLCSNGSLQTEIVQVTDTRQQVDIKSTGY